MRISRGGVISSNGVVVISGSGVRLGFNSVRSGNGACGSVGLASVGLGVISRVSSGLLLISLGGNFLDNFGSFVWAN